LKRETENKMFGRMILLFTLVPLVELYLLIKIGGLLGALPTVLLVVGTGVAGASLARQQGFQVWMRIQREMRIGNFPAEDMLDGLIIFAAGILLITPGVLTDILGLLALIPGGRRIMKQWLGRRLRRMMEDGNIQIHGFF